MPCLIKSIHRPLNTILRSVWSQFSPFVCQITNELHTLRNQKGEKKEILINKKPRSLSSPLSPQSVEAAQRSASTYSEYSDQTLP